MTEHAVSASSARADLLKEIDRLPPQYYGKVYDFLSYLQKNHICDTAQKNNDEKVSVYPETMLLSEAALAKDWDTPEEDEAWANL